LGEYGKLGRRPHERRKDYAEFSRTDRKGAIIAPVLEGTSEIEHLFRLKLVNFPFVLLENVKGIQATW